MSKSEYRDMRLHNLAHYIAEDIGGFHGADISRIANRILNRGKFTEDQLELIYEILNERVGYWST